MNRLQATCVQKKVEEIREKAADLLKLVETASIPLSPGWPRNEALAHRKELREKAKIRATEISEKVRELQCYIEKVRM